MSDAYSPPKPSGPPRDSDSSAPAVRDGGDQAAVRDRQLLLMVEAWLREAAEEEGITLGDSVESTPRGDRWRLMEAAARLAASAGATE